MFWGWLGKPYIVAVAVLTWGIGDTMAALVGKKYGRHKVRLPLADPNKSWEGSAAMAASGLLAAFLTLLVCSPFGAGLCLALALPAALLAAYVELISHNGSDTASVASAVAVLLAVLTSLL